MSSQRLRGLSGFCLSLELNSTDSINCLCNTSSYNMNITNQRYTSAMKDFIFVSIAASTLMAPILALATLATQLESIDSAAQVCNQ